MVSEILKHRANAGEYRGLYYYRDRQGVEIDLGVERGNHLTLVEAKSGQTAAADFYDSLRRGQAVIAAGRACSAMVVYGGATAQWRSSAAMDRAARGTLVMIGIMQGRLLPPMGGRIQCFPRGRWQEEFPLAAQAKLEAIEWIYDAFGAGANPLETDAGILEMRRVADAHRVRVVSLCADWCMEFPLVRTTPADTNQRLDRLRWLLGRCRQAGITRVVLPFVDSSKIQDKADMRTVISAITRTLLEAESAGVELHLEAALSPVKFSDMLASLDHPLVKVNYDSGNSASLGYDVREEFAAYGSRIGSVHLKDRVRGGGTVPLGKGNADFPALFDCLKAHRYKGDFILQVARGDSGAELPWAQRNLQTARSYIEALDFAKYGPGT